MSEVIKSVEHRRLQVWEQMKTISDAASAANRPLDGEENRQWTELNAELNALDERGAAIIAGEQRAKDIAEKFAALEGKPRTGETRSEVKDERSEIRAWMRGEGDRFYDVEKRDITVGNAAGAVDTGFRAQIWEYAVETSGVLSAGVDLLETDSGETIKLPRVTAYSATTSTAETVALTEAQDTISSVNSTVAKEGFYTEVSSEFLADNGVNIENYLARWAGRTLGNAVGTAAVTAAVAAAAAGATTAAGELTSLGAQGTVGKGADYLITLYYSVLAPYRNSRSCSWLTSDPGAAMIRKIKGTDGNYIWQPSVQVGAPDLLLGKPVYIDTNVADPAANAESVLFGDWSSLTVRIAGGYRFERSDDVAFINDMVTFRAIVRHGSVSKDANALKSLTHPAA